VGTPITGRSSLPAEKLADAARNRYIWPLVARAEVEAGTPRILREGSGVRVRDADGSEYLDLMSTTSRASSLGYSQDRIAAAVYDQLTRLHYGGTHASQADVTIELAAKLAELAPGDLNATFFVGSGSEANEAAFKLARTYHQARGRKPRAYKVISRWQDYHGAAGGAQAASDWLGVRIPSEPGPPGFSRIPGPRSYRCPFGLDPEAYGDLCAEYLERQIQQEGPELVSSVILEPIAQADGVQIPPPRYLRAVQDICRAYDVLLIADEVITGFGRTGEWFGFQHWDIEPDIITLAKAMTAGFLPLGAAMTTTAIHDQIPLFPDIHTYGGHPASAVASLTAIEIYSEQALVERAATEGAWMLEELRRLESLPVVGHVRGLGLWACADFCEPGTDEPLSREVLRAIAQRTRELGVIVSDNGTAIELAPPFVIERDDLAEGIARFEQAILEVCADRLG
jgi:putrescine---pyruvate transaminase